MPPWWLTYFVDRWRWFAVGTVVIIFGTIFLAFRAWAGCTTIPDIAQVVRRDAVCAQLGKPAGCYFAPKKLVEGILFSREKSWDLMVNRQQIGTFSFPANAQPADPTMCTNKDYVESLLRFHMGSSQIQALLRRKFPQDLQPGDVVFFDQLLGAPDKSAGLCVISAQLMVAHQ